MSRAPARVRVIRYPKDISLAITKSVRLLPTRHGTRVPKRLHMRTVVFQRTKWH